MPFINDYLDAAKKNLSLRSDRELAKKIGIKNSSLSYWRNAKTWPTEENILVIAELAKMDERQALIDLLEWKYYHNNRVRTVLEDLKKKLRSATVTALGLLLVLSATFSALPHNAKAAEICMSDYRLYIMENAVLRLRRFFKGLRS